MKLFKKLDAWLQQKYNNGGKHAWVYPTIETFIILSICIGAVVLGAFAAIWIAHRPITIVKYMPSVLLPFLVGTLIYRNVQEHRLNDAYAENLRRVAEQADRNFKILQQNLNLIESRYKSDYGWLSGEVMKLMETIYKDDLAYKAEKLAPVSTSDKDLKDSKLGSFTKGTTA